MFRYLALIWDNTLAHQRAALGRVQPGRDALQHPLGRHVAAAQLHVLRMALAGLDQRLARHNGGPGGAKSTRGRLWVLLYAERCATRGEAMSREWHLKRDRAFRRDGGLSPEEAVL